QTAPCPLCWPNVATLSAKKLPARQPHDARLRDQHQQPDDERWPVSERRYPCSGASPTQIPLLDKFQERGWVQRIVRPLEEDPDLIYSELLHEAVRGINEGHVNHLIEFHRDGTGGGVFWEYTAEAAAVLGRHSVCP